LRSAPPGPDGDRKLKRTGVLNSLTLLLLAAGAVASGLLLSRTEEDNAAGPSAPILGDGYYLKDAQLVGTGDDGELLYRINTRELLQGDGEVELVDVAFEYEPRAAVPWELRADKGRMPPEGDILRLSGKVVAVTRESDGAKATILTDYLEIDPRTFVAYTDSDVTIDLDGDQVFATGMRVFLKEDRLQLIADVTGTFTP